MPINDSNNQEPEGIKDQVSSDADLVEPEPEPEPYNTDHEEIKFESPVPSDNSDTNDHLKRELSNEEVVSIHVGRKMTPTMDKEIDETAKNTQPELEVDVFEIKEVTEEKQSDNIIASKEDEEKTKVEEESDEDEGPEHFDFWSGTSN